MACHNSPSIKTVPLGLRGPGLVLLIPFIERMWKVDLRVVTMDVPSQECITVDNVTIKVDAVIYFRVVDASQAILKVADFTKATYLLGQTTLRNVVGQSELDELLAHRDRLNKKIQEIVDEGTNPWGIKVSMVEVKDVELPDTMKRAMAAQAEAEREKRAKIVHAEGEYQAAEKLTEAAEIISRQPSALQLRYLQTLATAFISPFIDMACHNSPSIKTVPLGLSDVFVVAVFPIILSAPAVFSLFLSFITIPMRSMKNAAMTIEVPITRVKLILISGVWWNRTSEPIIREIIPPVVSSPKLVVRSSAIKKRIASRMRAIPPQ